ncbi:hypothetical protein [Diaminobutyricimonas sp. LJ205]|uniref:hypothetical protein n=1 Tax=Diaminobutyricimonas sp. LJ205 TaxID=2683590 RepID=UPI0012F4CE4E|nr:hypothetical protein [Diaminobutyricimonas sp. LJ205]
MTRRRLLFTILGVLAAAALITVVLVNLGGAPAATPATQATPSPTPTAGPGREARSDPPGDTETKADTDGKIPGETTLPRPPADDRPPLVQQPLPPSGSAQGELVAGFPSDLLPIATEDAVARSSVTTEGNHMQAGVEASSPRSATEVIAYYQATYATLGLAAREIEAVSGSTAYAFARGDNTITLTVVPATSGSTFTLFGAFRAG